MLWFATPQNTPFLGMILAKFVQIYPSKYSKNNEIIRKNILDF